ncbi:MAG TPA: hypothetical protein PKK23_06720 [Nitrospirales bacterium]|nr:hypothetical protein [Nitrospirales bacterium]
MAPFTPRRQSLGEFLQINEAKYPNLTDELREKSEAPKDLNEQAD